MPGPHIRALWRATTRARIGGRTSIRHELNPWSSGRAATSDSLSTRPEEQWIGARDTPDESDRGPRARPSTSVGLRQ